MKLSEAIRIGSAFRPQAKGGYFRGAYEKKDFCSCVMGAAYEGVAGRCTYRPTDCYVYLSLHQEFKDANDRAVKCPVRSPDLPGSLPSCRSIRTIFNLCIHLNDQHGWTRQQIAELLEANGL